MASQTSGEGFILTGEKLFLPEREKFLGEYFFNALKKYEVDKLFQIIIETGEKMTFHELFKTSAQICQALIDDGLKPGDIVALIGRNSNYLHASFIGTIWAGGIPHPLHPDITLVEMQLLLQQTKASYVFCEPQSLSVAVECLKILNSRAKLLNFNAHPNSSTKRLEDMLTDIDLNKFSPRLGQKPTDIAIVLTSSGTTGIPKCVALTHENILHNIFQWENLNEFNFTEPHLVTSPFTWVTGIFFLVISCYYGSFRVVTMSSEPGELLEIIQKYKLCGAILMPHVLKNVLDSPKLKSYDTSCLRQVWTGGSRAEKQTIHKFEAEWPDKLIFLVYGMTETGGMVSRPTVYPKPFSVGKPIYNTEIKFVDPKHGQTLNPYEFGEIYIRTKSIFKTYLGNEEAAQNTMENGWIKSGDIGYGTSDGYFYVISRIKESIAINNEDISPYELEEYLLSIPGVNDAGVTAINTELDDYCLVALIKKYEDVNITSSEIWELVRRKINNMEHILHIYFVDHLPRSAFGKLLRKELKQLAIKLYK